MLDNPFVLLFLVCGGPLGLLGLTFAAGYWAGRRGYRIARPGRNGRAQGVGYAAAGPDVAAQRHSYPSVLAQRVDRAKMMRGGQP